MKCVVLFVIGILRLAISTPIVNGNYEPDEPNVEDHPYHANLMEKYPFNYRVSFCGGSLIHTRWVLTAAHCIQIDYAEPAFQPWEVLVGLGSILLDSSDGQLIEPKRFIMHPTYLKTDRNDIGLVLLKTPAKLGPKVNIITLHLNNKENLVGKTVYLTGFGATDDFDAVPDRLRKAVLHVGNYSECFDDMKYSTVEICGVSTIAEGKACRGDSGGPLVLMKNKRYIQIGITSHLATIPLCSVGFNNSVYTRVSAYLSWISEMTGINILNHKKNKQNYSNKRNK